MPAISVIIPIYNTEATLPRCIDSVLAQSFTDYEIILVDDGTPDGAGRIADDYAARHSCINVVHQPNRGLAEARKTGQHTARGEYRLHLDSDDTLPADALEFLFTKASENNLDIVYGGFNRVRNGIIIQTPTRGYEKVVDGKQMLHNLLNPEFTYIGGICFSRSYLWDDDNSFPPAGMRLPSEDTLMNINIAIKAHRVGIYEHPVYNYNYNPNSLTSVGTFYKTEPMKQLFALVRQTLSQHNLLNEANEQAVRAMEIHFTGFFIGDLDKNNKWIDHIAHYDNEYFSRKIKVLQFLIRHPWMHKTAIGINRFMKRALRIQHSTL